MQTRNSGAASPARPWLLHVLFVAFARYNCRHCDGEVRGREDDERSRGQDRREEEGGSGRNEHSREEYRCAFGGGWSSNEERQGIRRKQQSESGAARKMPGGAVGAGGRLRHKARHKPCRPSHHLRPAPLASGFAGLGRTGTPNRCRAPPSSGPPQSCRQLQTAGRAGQQRVSTARQRRCAAGGKHARSGQPPRRCGAAAPGSHTLRSQCPFR